MVLVLEEQAKARRGVRLSQVGLSSGAARTSGLMNQIQPLSSHQQLLSHLTAPWGTGGGVSMVQNGLLLNFVPCFEQTGRLLSSCPSQLFYENNSSPVSGKPGFRNLCCIPQALGPSQVGALDLGRPRISASAPPEGRTSGPVSTHSERRLESWDPVFCSRVPAFLRFQVSQLISPQ